LLKDNQKSMIKYFWEEKDVRSYVDWEDIQQDLKKECPGLWFAFTQLHLMENVIDSILKGDEWL